nr:MAG TPA: hypothetical protein [Caudoviricetes sp.]
MKPDMALIPTKLPRCARSKNNPPDDGPAARAETTRQPAGQGRGSQPQIKNGRKYNHEKPEGQAHLY